MKSAKNEEEEKQLKQLLANYLRRLENVPVVLAKANEPEQIAPNFYGVLQDVAVNANYSDLAPRPIWQKRAIFLVGRGTRIFFCYLDHGHQMYGRL